MSKKKTAALTKRKTTKRFWLKVLILTVFVVLSAAILSIDFLPTQITWQEGEVADKDVFYRGHNTEYISYIKTELARAEAAAQVEPIFTLDESVLTRFLAKINNDFAYIESLRNNTVLEIESRQTSLRNALPGEFSNETLQYILEIDFNEMSNIRRNLREFVTTVYEQGIRDEDLLTAKDDIAILLYRTRLSDEGLSFLLAYLNGLTLAANEHYDYEATEIAKLAARFAVTEMLIPIQKDEMLISRGTVITAEQIEALRELGMYSVSPRYPLYGGLLTIVVMLTVLLGFYLYYYQSKLFEQDKSLLLLCVIILLVLLICRLIAFIDFSADADTSAQIGFLLPVATASMLIAVLLERNLAFYTTIILAIYVCLIFQGKAAYALIAIGGGLAGILSTTRLNQRSQFVGASIFVALTNVALIGGWGLLNNQNISIIGLGMVIGLFNGILSAVLAMGILPFLESAFSVTTVVRLLEFSNLNHPLLKRLMMEAPGTYNHCVLVGNLAETAADAIGANALLVRVASYYHDIGKLKRPYLFIENQGVNDNPHDKLQPSLSVMIITSHVREGVEMLRQARFPEEIISLVEQHHGTGLLRMFYKKAQEQALDSSTIREEDFRYPYSKPQSKEAALVLLADMTQAAAQALKQAAKGQIEETVHNIIKGRMEDGQLLECPLTFQDMQLIEEAFLRVLSGMNHSRLVYPEQTVKETRGNTIASVPDYNPQKFTAGNTTAQNTDNESSPADN